MHRVLLLSLPLLAVGEGRSELGDRQLAELHRYNNRPSLAIGERRKLHSFARVTPREAKRIAKECDSGSVAASIRLVREHKKLYYLLESERAVVKVNALDGKVIGCERSNR